MKKGWLSEFIYDATGVEIPMTSQQKGIVLDLDNNKINNYLKSRQIGFSTLLENYIAKKLILETDFTIALVGDRLNKVKKSLRHIGNIIHLHQPNLLNVGSVSRLNLNNGNTLHISSFTTDSLRGFGFDLLIFEECYSESLLSSSLPVISGRNSSLIIGSSLNTEEFAKYIYQGTNVKKLHYSDCSLYDEEKIIKCKLSLGDSFKYEYDLDVKGFLDKFKLEKSSKNRVLQFRVGENLEYKILERLIEKDISFSEYMRSLIKKDLNI